MVLKIVGKADSIEIGRKLLNFPNLRFVDAGEAVMARAANISEKYNLDPRDAIHCGSALVKNLKTVISDDIHLEKCKELKRIPLEDY